MAACGGGGSDADTDGGQSDFQDSSSDTSGGTNAGTRSKDGHVTVDGTVFGFSFDPPGRCGLVAADGSIAAQGFMIDDPSRQVAFLYSLSEDSPDGSDWLQIVLYDEDGQQLWYSKVGFGGEDVGSVESLSRNGNTVSASGQLNRVADGTPAGFTAEATCNQ